jgi:hypothetical protein
MVIEMEGSKKIRKDSGFKVRVIKPTVNAIFQESPVNNPDDESEDHCPR